MSVSVVFSQARLRWYSQGDSRYLYRRTDAPSQSTGAALGHREGILLLHVVMSLRDASYTAAVPSQLAGAALSFLKLLPSSSLLRPPSLLVRLSVSLCRLVLLDGPQCPLWSTLRLSSASCH